MRKVKFLAKKKKESYTYIRHCKDCEELYKPISKSNYYCVVCLGKRNSKKFGWRTAYYNKKRKNKK